MAEAWRKKRTPIKAKLTRFRNQFAANNKSLGLGTWTIQLERFEPLFVEFDTVQTEIDMASRDEDIPAENLERIEFENAYFDIVAQVREFIEENRSRNSAASAASCADTRDNETRTQPSSLIDIANLLSATSLASG